MTGISWDDWGPWLNGNYDKTIDSFFSHIIDEDTYEDKWYGESEGYNSAEEMANMADNLELLLFLPKRVYTRIKEEMPQITKGRWCVFSAIQQDLDKHPNHFDSAKDIILENLEATEGSDALDLCVLETFDLFSLEEQELIIDKLSRRGSPFTDLFRILNDILNSRSVDAVLLVTALEKLRETLRLDITNVKQKMNMIMKIFAVFSSMMPEFRGFSEKDAQIENSDDRGPIEEFVAEKELPIPLYQSLFQKMISLLNYPPFTLYSIPADDFKSLLEHLAYVYRQKMYNPRSDQVLRDPEIFEDISTSLSSTQLFFEHFQVLCAYLRRMLNFEDALSTDVKTKIHEEVEIIEASINFIFKMPVRMASRVLMRAFQAQLTAAEGTYDTLQSYMISRTNMISIIGPFANESDDTMKDYEKIASQLRLEGFQPCYIPGKFSGAANSVLFDIFVNMSKCIVCYYKASNSSGHVDEMSRLLDRRDCPPVILLSPCEFPTTTQIEGIRRRSDMNIFCFKKDSSGIDDCPHGDICAFRDRCQSEGHLKQSVDDALNQGIEWLKQLENV
jgi:hypothetical protein